MKVYILIILLLIILFVLNYYYTCEKYQSIAEEACSYNISDINYLKHMIPHHQVAIDISIELQKITKWPEMQEILRKLIWTQQYEIALMNYMLNSLPNDMSINDSKMDTTYQSSIASFINPNKVGLTNTYCDPHFFNPKEHMKHMSHMKLTDENYIEHMIPHHQVAVDMSKKLLKNTNNDFMIYLAYRIIRSQESEIIMLQDLKKSTFKNKFYFNFDKSEIL